MKIIKFCPKRHHISSVSSIQLGNLEYYRLHKKPEIKDSSEGRHLDQIEHTEPVTYSTNEINKLNLNVKFEGPGTITVGKKIEINEIVNNVYIFCSTKIEDGENPNTEMGKQFGEDYDSFYEIKDLQKFTDKISELLLQMLPEAYPENGLLKIYSCHGEIQYVGDKKTTFRNISEAILDRKNRNGLEIVFTKTKESLEYPSYNFEKNREYRFAWFIFDEKQNPINTKHQTILINALSLKEFTG